MQNDNGKPKVAPPSVGQFKAEIEAIAKAIFLKRQKTEEPGEALSDWLKAEKAIKEKYHIH